MNKVYSCKLEVRGYEIDAFQHVNHAVYVQYMEHARWKMLAEEGVTLSDFEHWKRWPVIAGLEAKYLKPVYTGEKLEIRSEIVDVTKTTFTCRQEIVRGAVPVFRGKVQIVIVNEKGRPSATPDKLLSIWKANR